MTAYVVSAAPGACVYADEVSVTFSPRNAAVGMYTIAVRVQDWNTRR